MKRRRLSKLQSAVYSTPWAILPSKLDEIVSLVDSQVLGTGVRQGDTARVHLPLISVEPMATYGQPTEQQVGSKIAVLNLYGTIAQRMNIMMEFSGGTSTQMFGKAFDAAVADPEISAIVIRVDSPGGAVPGVEELSDKIYAARGKKRILAFVDPQMCSAATWIASSAAEIISTPSAYAIGSIGVLFVHCEQTKRHALAGDTYTVFRSVPHKAEGTPYEPLSEAHAEDLQAKISAIHTKFVAAIARNRGVTPATVDAKFGGGRCLMATEALAAGLIDRIATFEDVLKELGARASAPTQPGAVSATNLRSVSMNPKVRLALVQAGLIRATASADEAQAALNLVFEARGQTVPTSDDAILAALNPQSAVTVLQQVAAPLQAVTGTVERVANVAPAPKTGVSTMEIMGLVRTAGAALTDTEKLTLQTELINANEASPLTLTAVLDKINEKAVAATQPAGAGRVQVTADATDKFMASARDAILLRDLKGDQPKQIYDYRTKSHVDWKPDHRNYGLTSPLGIMRQCLIHCGVSAMVAMNLTPYELAKLAVGADPAQLGISGMMAGGPAYNVSGMFSNILLDAQNVSLRNGFDTAETTYQAWAGKGPDIADFRPVHRILSGELGDPKAIPEDGTFDEVTLTDGKESYRLHVWGSVISLSFELIQNDQLGAFTNVQPKLGNAMKRKLNRLVYGQLKDNPKLSDGGDLFNSTAITSAGGHNNLATGAISGGYDGYRAAFSTLNRKMRAQKGLSADSSVLNISPKYVLYPGALKDSIETVLISPSLAAATAGNSNTLNNWAGKLQPIEEEELGLAAGGSDTAFYLAASPMSVETVEYAFMQGMPAPVIEEMAAFDRLAIRKRIYFAFAVKALDFRGLQKHSGA